MAACKTWPGESDPELPEARPGCVWKELNCVTPCIKNKNKSVKGLKKPKRVNYLSFVFKSRTDIHTDISSLPIHLTVFKLMTVSESISNLYWWKSVLQSRSVIKLFNFLECFLNFWRHAEPGNLMHFWLKFSNRDFYLIRFKTIFFFTFSCHFPSCYKCTSWSTINRIGIGLGEKKTKKHLGLSFDYVKLVASAIKLQPALKHQRKHSRQLDGWRKQETRGSLEVGDV